MSLMKRPGRLKLLATTSLVACAVLAAPVSVDVELRQPVLKVAFADSSCFTAGTLVLMADGTQRPIESLRAGDLVMAGDGTANRVVAVETPRLGNRLLYAIDGGEAFVTAEHPFLTAEGWKSIDPSETARENAALRVGRLRVGDRLARAVGPQRPASHGALALAMVAELEIAYLPLRRLRAIAGEPGQTLYNLILDGDHAYFANGFLVHNKGGEGGEGGEGGSSGSGSGGSGSGSSGSGGGGSGSSGSGGSGSGGGDDGGGDDGGSDSSGSGSGGDSDDGGGGDDGDNSGSGRSGGDDGDADEGDDGDNSGSGSANSGSSDDDSDDDNRSGKSGSSGSGSGESGGGRDAFGGVDQVGPDLSRDQEAGAISSGWK